MSDNPYTAPDEIGHSIVKPSRWTVQGFAIRVIVYGGGLILLLALLMPTTRTANNAARRSQCSNNLKQIGLALLIYHDTYGEFPPAYTVDDKGNHLHSWRTLLLPFLEQKTLYESIDLKYAVERPCKLGCCQDVSQLLSLSKHFSTE